MEVRWKCYSLSTHTQSHKRLDAGPTLLINTSFACRNFNHWQRSKDQEDDNYDDVVIAATTMRKTCQCMCHECRHKRRKEKGVYWRGALGGGWWMRGRGKSTTSADNPNNRPHIPYLPSRQVAKRNAFATKGKTFILAGICSVVLHAF